jgi:NADPH:quinone reductase-like Zn-dependent oxidoreductase
VKAVAYTRHGGPDVLELVEVADPRPGEQDAVVAVRAAAVNRMDLLQRQGPPLIPGFTLPHIAGMDVAGEVVELGPAANGVAVGDRVLVKAGIHCGRCARCAAGETWRCEAGELIGGNRAGGYAERCVVPVSNLSLIPDHASFAEAAAVPTAFSTAWRGLMLTGNIRLGETVVIHGAGSGVSVFAIQLAKRAGATVIATSRSDTTLAKAAELGADVVVNTTSGDLVAEVRLATGGAGADLVFDHIGPALFLPSIQSLRPGGRIVFCGVTTGRVVELPLPTLYHAGISLLGVRSQTFGEYRQMLERYWHSGIRAVIDEELPLSRAADAHRRLDDGGVFGKLVLLP